MAYKPRVVRVTNGFWPDVSSWEGGIVAAKQGRWACIFISALSIIASMYLIRSNNGVPVGWAGYLMIQGLVFVPIAVGVHKHSRFAIVIGLVLYCLGQALIASDTGEVPGIIPFFLVLGLVNGVRGIFAVHRIPRPNDIIEPADRVRRIQRGE